MKTYEPYHAQPLLSFAHQDAADRCDATDADGATEVDRHA